MNESCVIKNIYMMNDFLTGCSCEHYNNCLFSRMRFTPNGNSYFKMILRLLRETEREDVLLY